MTGNLLDNVRLYIVINVHKRGKNKTARWRKYKCYLDFWSTVLRKVDIEFAVNRDFKRIYDDIAIFKYSDVSEYTYYKSEIA